MFAYSSSSDSSEEEDDFEFCYKFRPIYGFNTGASPEEEREFKHATTDQESPKKRTSTGLHPKAIEWMSESMSDLLLEFRKENDSMAKRNSINNNSNNNNGNDKDKKEERRHESFEDERGKEEQDTSKAVLKTGGGGSSSSPTNKSKRRTEKIEISVVELERLKKQEREIAELKIQIERLKQERKGQGEQDESKKRQKGARLELRGETTTEKTNDEIDKEEIEKERRRLSRERLLNSQQLLSDSFYNIQLSDKERRMNEFKEMMSARYSTIRSNASGYRAQLILDYYSSRLDQRRERYISKYNNLLQQQQQQKQQAVLEKEEKEGEEEEGTIEEAVEIASAKSAAFLGSAGSGKKTMRVRSNEYVKMLKEKFRSESSPNLGKNLTTPRSRSTTTSMMSPQPQQQQQHHRHVGKRRKSSVTADRLRE